MGTGWDNPALRWHSPSPASPRDPSYSLGTMMGMFLLEPWGQEGTTLHWSGTHLPLAARAAPVTL